jgi:hypothetical protein
MHSMEHGGLIVRLLLDSVCKPGFTDTPHNLYNCTQKRSIFTQIAYACARF